MSLWAITAYFNPVKYESRRLAYKAFRRNLCVPLVTVELSFDGRFDLQKDDADILIQISGSAVLWQTQRLLNIALKHVPSNVNKIAWMDCDILFGDSDWFARAEDALENYSYIQPFSDAIMLRRGEQIKDQNSNYDKRIAVTKLCQSGDLNILAQRRGHNVPFAMLAWAARRDCLEQHKFYDAAIVGGADMLFFSALNNKPDFAIWRFNLNSVFAEHYARWATHIPKPSVGNFGCIDGEIWHLWHGELVNRHRTSRWNLVKDFNPFLDIKLSDNEVWEFTEEGRRLEAGIKSFFISRQEDG
jgi:hypothetical protein